MDLENKTNHFEFSRFTTCTCRDYCFSSIVDCRSFRFILPIKSSFLETCYGLHISNVKQLKYLVNELRYGILAAILIGFGRAMAEVGAVMMVGGNIRYKTRVMTTAIVLETNQGNYKENEA